MSEGGNHNERISDRESRRLTAFVSHNFTDAGDSILRRIIGSHTLTGLLGEDTHEEDYRQWQRYRVGEAYYDYLDPKTPEERLFKRFIWVTPSSPPKMQRFRAPARFPESLRVPFAALIPLGSGRLILPQTGKTV